MFDLAGKIAVVTGASRGIGRGIALALASRGALVVAAARGENAAETVAEIAAAGGKAEVVRPAAPAAEAKASPLIQPSAAPASAPRPGPGSRG